MVARRRETSTEAVAWCESRLEVSRKSGDVWFMVQALSNSRLAHHQLGHNKEAVAAFEEEAKRSPQDFTTIYYLADALEKDGNAGSARERIDVALKLDPQSPEANGLLGRIFFKQGKAAEALKPLEFAAAKKPADHESRYTLARVYQQLGRRADAAREFAEVERLKSEQLQKDRARTPKP